MQEILPFLNSLLAMLNQMSPYILLGFLIAGVLQSFVNPALMGRHLAGNGFMPVLKAALLGIPLPLCSCGVLPAAVSLRRNGASDAATTSFLIATPQTGVDSIAATYSLLGPAFAVTRPVAALLGAVFGGVVAGRISPAAADDADKTTTAPECDCADDDACGYQPEASLWQKTLGALRYGFVDMVASVGRWLVIGLVIAAAITVFVPDSLFLGLAEYPLLAMLVMVAVAIPMYVCATGSIPIALSLMIKGLSPGVAFVLLMAGPAANFASVMVLRRAMGTRATVAYVGSVVVTAIAVGLAIEYLLPTSWFMPHITGHTMCCHTSVSVFDTICSVVLCALLAYALLLRKSPEHKHNISDKMKRTYKIKGMMCAHCQANVQKGLESIPGVQSVVVNLSAGTAEVVGDVPQQTVIDKILSLGYEVE